MMWEILALKIFNSLYQYSYIKKEALSNVEFSRIMTEMIQRLFRDADHLNQAPDAIISEFGTRRAFSTDYQRMANEILDESLGTQYVGTSNVQIAKER
jgi:nicotinic acid phosphoribosyltransferase